MTLFSSTERKHRRTYKDPPLTHKHADPHSPSGTGGASFSGAVFNLSTTIVGAGIMALPAAVKQLGLLPGTIMIIFAAVLTSFSVDMLLRFGRASKCATYSAVVENAFGGAGRMLLHVCIVVNNLGMLVIYMIIIGDVLSGTWSNGVRSSGVLEEWFGKHWWTWRPCSLLLTTLLVFAPLISLKRVDSLRYTSALSVGLAVVFVVINAGIAIVKLIDGSVQMPHLMPKFAGQVSLWKLFATLPVIFTAYICQHNIYPIENELKDPMQMKPIVRSSLILCSVVYIATSFFGFILFGDNTMDDILSNFDGDLGIPYSSLLDDVVRISYGIHLMLVFPIVFFSLRLNLDELLFPHAIPISFDNRRFFSITAALMSFIYLGANFVPSIWDAFQFTGATAAVSVGYIFPASVTLRDTHGITTKRDRLVAWVMILLAVSSSTVAISSDLYRLFSQGN